jgi:hypothetical protein
MTLLALAVSAGDPIPEECNEHPNYHVRRAAWLAAGLPIPEKTEDKLALLKSVQPNLFARAAAFKTKDNAKVAHRADEIKRIREHNAKAVLLREADEGKFLTLAAWLPIYQRDLRKFGEDPKSSQAEYNARAAVAHEVDTWIRERCQQPVPEPITPVAYHKYRDELCVNNEVGFILLSAAVAEALPVS